MFFISNMNKNLLISYQTFVNELKHTQYVKCNTGKLYRAALNQSRGE